MSDFFRLKKIDYELQKVINPVSFFDVNPLNLDSEKEIVLKDPDYNPYFIYSTTPFDFEQVQKQLASIDEHESALGELLNDKRNLFIDKCEMLKSRGSDKFTVFSKKVYGLPSRAVLDRAVSFLSLESENEEKVISSRKAVNMIQAEVRHQGFDYEVSSRQMSASAMVLVSKKRIYVKDNSMFSENYVRRLMIHEIGTHVLRAENGKDQPFMIFFHGFPNYLSTEEGLAVVNEERFGLLNNENLKNYAARAIAVKMAMSKSFSEIYNYLRQFFPDSTAFKITARAKRGLADTSRPGGCTKDYVYISGYMKVKKYLDNGGSLDALYAGKVGVEHIDRIKGVQNLSRPRFLPKNQTFKSLLSF
ncbi:flavohemoglobin expression-modulating QEGLA motif protein [Candidatus Woesearchaeota archaeon]|nr:flavohemoglobin expression-modulating QEGLA motif protein [Candidatus Woesearchaeota archaeon]